MLKDPAWTMGHALDFSYPSPRGACVCALTSLTNFAATTSTARSTLSVTPSSPLLYCGDSCPLCAKAPRKPRTSTASRSSPTKRSWNLSSSCAFRQTARTSRSMSMGPGERDLLDFGGGGGTRSESSLSRWRSLDELDAPDGCRSRSCGLPPSGRVLERHSEALGEGVGRADGCMKEDRELGKNEGIESPEKLGSVRGGGDDTPMQRGGAVAGGGSDGTTVAGGVVGGVERRRSWSR